MDGYIYYVAYTRISFKKNQHISFLKLPKTISVYQKYIQLLTNFYLKFSIEPNLNFLYIVTLTPLPHYIVQRNHKLIKIQIY